MTTISRIVRDPIWQFISVGIGIVGLIALIISFFLGQEFKALEVVILASTSLVEVDPSVAENIRVLYKDKPVSNLSLFQTRIENRGTQTIREEDYVQPIQFVFPSQAEIVDAMVLESSPPNIGMTVTMERNVVTLSPVLLNEGDRVIVRFIVINMPTIYSAQPIMIHGRIAGVKDIRFVTAIERTETTGGGIPPILTEVIVALLVGLIGVQFAYGITMRAVRRQAVLETELEMQSEKRTQKTLEETLHTLEEIRDIQKKT